MIYSQTITTDGEGAFTRAAPKKTILKVTRGLVYKVVFDFPPGSAGLLGVVILDGSFQVWPSTVGQWFTGDGVVIDFEDVYLKESAPFEFLVRSYNEDDIYPHLFNLRIGLVSKEIFMARYLPHLSYKYYADYIAGLAAEQEKLKQDQADEIIKTPFEWLK